MKEILPKTYGTRASENNLHLHYKIEKNVLYSDVNQTHLIMYNDRKELESIVRTFVSANNIDLTYYKQAFAERYKNGRPVNSIDSIVYYFVENYGRPWKHGHNLDAAAEAQYKPELKSWIYQHQLREYFESLGCFLPTPSEALPADEVMSKEEIRELVLAWFKKHRSSPLADYCLIFSITYWHREDISDEQVIINYFVHTAYRPWKTKWIYEQEVRGYFEGMDYMFESMANID